MKTLGKFEIIEKIGQGAMGVVYKARDPYIGRLVALKTITVGLAEDPALLERFYQEARSAGALQHPNIVTIYELGKEGDTPFIAMEFLEGGSLDKVIESRAQLSTAQKLGYIVHVCRALEYAHARGVVHRDIKPGNVMVTSEGTVKVVDFGIARLVGSGRTQTGLLIGTLGYMSPQLIRGKHADARSDIWAVGIMLFELLANQRPFNGENHADLMMNILTQTTPPVPGIGATVPAEVETVIGKMLAKDAEARYQSMQEVLIELNPVCDRVQQQEVSQLIHNGQQLLEARELDRAQEVVRRVLQYDTANVHAKSLLERINAEVRRQQAIPQMQARVQKAQGLLTSKQFDEAKAEAEAALQMDSSFLPARELLAQVQAAADKERELVQALRTGKQRLIEGDLVDAEGQLSKALLLDPSSIAAQDLDRQIREEKSRRERQKKLTEVKHRARAMWSELRYQECIDLLTQARDEFPNDFEISKLLETAQQDKTEHEKQTQLTEARGMLGAQRFDDALKLLDNVLKLSPTDTSASNLRNVALQGREQQILEQRLRSDMENLRALVKSGKYQESITRGEELMKQFPKEFEIGELVSYAKNEQAQVERKLRREQWIEKINRAIAAEHYAEAVQAVEAATGEFPRDIDLKILLEKAKQKQEQKERAELLDRRIRDVRSKIKREELTDAIALARETIVTLGPDTDIRQLLNQAEVEYGQREKKRQTQQDTLQAAETLIERGSFAEATRKIEDALATRLFAPSDPEVTALLRSIDSKKTPPPPTAAPKPPSSAPSPAAASWTTPSQDPAKDYVYQQGANLPQAPPAAPQDGSASMIFSATSVTGPSVQPVLPPPPAAVPEIKQPAKSEPAKSKKRKSEIEEEKSAEDFSATRIEQSASATQIAPALPVKEPVQQPAAQKPAVVPAAVRPTASVPPVQRAAAPPTVRPPVEAASAAASQPGWKNPIVLGGIAAVAALGIFLAIHFTKSPTPATAPRETATEAPAQPVRPGAPSDAADWNAAQNFLQSSPLQLTQALTLFQKVIDLGGEHKNSASQQIAGIKQTQQTAQQDIKLGDQAQQDKKWDEAQRHYEDAESLDDDLKQQSEVSIANVKKLAAGKPPEEVAKDIFAQADQLFADKQWQQAGALYQQVKDMQAAPAALRSNAGEKLTQVNAHLQQDALYQRAVQLRDAGQLDQAKNSFDAIVKQKGDHAAEAQQALADIDSRLKAQSAHAALKDQIESALNGRDIAGARNLYKEYVGGGPDANDQVKSEIDGAEDRVFGDLKTKLDTAKKAGDANALNALLPDFRKIAGGGGKDAEAANGIVSSGIPGAIAEINNNKQQAEDRQRKEDDQWKQALADFQGSEKDTGSLQGKVKSEFQAISSANGKHAADAAKYLDDDIPRAIDASEKAAVKKVFDDLSGAFGGKNVGAIQQLWPSIPSKQADTLKVSFSAVKSFSRNFVPANIAVNGDSATATGTWSGVVDTGSGKAPSNGIFQATLKNRGGRWTIVTLTM